MQLVLVTYCGGGGGGDSKYLPIGWKTGRD